MAGSAPKPHILVVDDEPGLRDMLAIFFKREAMDVTIAPGFAQGRDAVVHAPEPYAIVLTDLLMPDGNGLDLISLVKQRTARTEVIVMTAHGQVETAIEAMKRGAYDFVTKPFATSELRAIVHKALEKRAIVTENERLRAQLLRERGQRHFPGRAFPLDSARRGKLADLHGDLRLVSSLGVETKLQTGAAIPGTAHIFILSH